MEVDAVATPLAQLTPVGVVALPPQHELARNDEWNATSPTMVAGAAHGGLGPAIKRVATLTDVLPNPILLVPWNGFQSLATLTDAVTEATMLRDSLPPPMLTVTACKHPVFIGPGHNQYSAALALGHTVITA